jgi:hypothetical protein
MKREQITAIKCAFADLCGALEAYHQGDMRVHDWRAHGDSITELFDAFSEECDLEMPESLRD